MSQEWYTPKEVSELIRVSTHVIYRAIRRGDIQAVRLGKKTLRIPSTEVHKWGRIKEQEQTELNEVPWMLQK